MARIAGNPRLITPTGVTVPDPVLFTDQTIAEHQIQQLLDDNPGLIPIEQIGRAWGPLVPLGREIPTPAGPIDNLFVSPTGELTVVEAKLWRNPESRRKVVGQVLDYAAALRTMSYEELDSAVADSGSDFSIWEAVVRSSAIDESSEAEFVDTVHRNLRSGRFLLLIVGDGIREDIEGLADLIGSHPDMGFHLELVEIRLYRLGADLLVVPSLVARTKEIVRAVIEVRGDAQVQVSVGSEEEPESSATSRRPLRSLEAFSELLSDHLDEEQADAAVRFAKEWELRGGNIKLNNKSINLGVPFRHSPTGREKLMNLYGAGYCQLNAEHLVEQVSALTIDEAEHLVAEHGFYEGTRAHPRQRLNLVDATQYSGLLEMLDYVARRVAEQDDRLDGESSA